MQPLVDFYHMIQVVEEKTIRGASGLKMKVDSYLTSGEFLVVRKLGVECCTEFNRA